MTEPTYKRVCRVIADLSGFAAETIGSGQSLGQQQTPNFYWHSLVIHSVPTCIGFDSLDLITLAMKLEDEFSIKISDDEVDSSALDHVGGLVAFVQGKVDALPRPNTWLRPLAIRDDELVGKTPGSIVTIQGNTITETLHSDDCPLCRVAARYAGDINRPGAEL